MVSVRSITTSDNVNEEALTENFNFELAIQYLEYPIYPNEATINHSTYYRGGYLSGFDRRSVSLGDGTSFWTGDFVPTLVRLNGDVLSLAGPYKEDEVSTDEKKLIKETYRTESLNFVDYLLSLEVSEVENPNIYFQKTNPKMLKYIQRVYRQSEPGYAGIIQIVKEVFPSRNNPKIYYTMNLGLLKKLYKEHLNSGKPREEFFGR